MARLYYNQKFKVDGKPQRHYGTFDIYNWRFIKCGKYIRNNDGSEVDGLIVRSNYAAFIPHLLSIEDIHSLNRIYKKDENVEQFFTEHWIMDPPACPKCWGRGKMDWIEMAMDTPFSKKHVTGNPEMYERDTTSLLIYPDKHDTIVFSRTVLKEGEEYCPYCHGSGVDLDGRYIVFKGMPALRKLLKPKSHCETKRNKGDNHE